MQSFLRALAALLIIATVLSFQDMAMAMPRTPLPPQPDEQALYYEGFDEPFWTDPVDSEVVLPAIGAYEESWSGDALQRSGADVVPFVIPAMNSSGETNISSDTAGAFRWWVRPYWSTGGGPGATAPILQFYAASGGDILLCWSLQAAADGSAISLVASSDSGPEQVFSAAISWEAGDSHLLALDYNAQGTAFFIDGQLAGQGAALAAISPTVGELVLGSTLAGDVTAGADFDEFYSFAAPLTQGDLAAYGQLTTNEAALGPMSLEELEGMSQMSSIGSTNSVYDPNTSTPCNPGGLPYFTNFTASAAANGTMNISFVINGGIEGVFYDIYRITNLSGIWDPENWVWVGQGLTCNAYSFTNQPAGAAFYKLVEPTSTTLWAWGVNSSGQCNVPAGLSNAVAVAGGYAFSLALNANGMVSAWGDNTHGQTNVPHGLSNVVAIAAGDFHGVALLSNGVAVEWGDYRVGSTTYSTVPSNAPFTNLIAVSASLGHDIGLTRSNTIVTWGASGDSANFTPLTVTNVPGVIAVGCGWEYNAAIMSNGVVKAWGYTNDNPIYGFLNVPASLTNAAFLNVGPQHSLAITRGGKVVSWGFSNDGQTNVPAGLTNVAAVAASSDQSLALLGNGTLVAWGATNTPEGLPPTNLIGVKAIAGGFEHHLAIMSDGLEPLEIQPDVGYALAGKNFTFSVGGIFMTNLSYQWQFDGTNIPGATGSTLTVTNASAANDGVYTVTISNSGGQVTRSATLQLAQAPQIAGTIPPTGLLWYNTNLALNVAVTNIGESVYPAAYQWQLRGTNIPGATSPLLAVPPDGSDDGVISLVITNAAGTTNVSWTLRLALPGMVEGSGDNVYGESSPTLSLTNATAIAAGDYDSVAITDAGTVVQWGELWDGVNYYALTNAPANNNFVAVAASRSHSIALTSGGSVATWGLAWDPANYVPTGMTPVSAVSAGWSNNLVLFTNGIVWGWGDNTYGQLNIPTNLTTTNAAMAVAAGALHCLALRTNGTVEAWGNNAYGQCNVPASLSNVVAIAAGQYHSLALQANGCVVAWGLNTSGQTNVPSGATNNIMAIAAGKAHSVALKNDGTLVEWGDDSFGEANAPVYSTSGYATNYSAPPTILYPAPVVAKLIAAGGAHTLASIFSPIVQYQVNPANDLLLIYNTNSLDSSNVWKYYLTHRPMVSMAISLGIGCTTRETFLPDEFTNVFEEQLTAWLEKNPTKRPQYVVLFPEIPTRINTITNIAYYYLETNEYPSVQYYINLLTSSGWRPFVTAINMEGAGGSNDCIQYINKVASFASNSPSKLFVSAKAQGYENTNWLFDDSISNIVQVFPYDLGYQAEEGVLSFDSSAQVEFSANQVIVAATNLAAYYSRGCHNGVWTNDTIYPIDGALVFRGQSKWYAMVTDESYSGLRGPTGTSCYIDWFASNAFGGSSYSSVPIGAFTQVDEPGTLEANTSIFFGYWATGKTLSCAAWDSFYFGNPSRYLQVVGDPFVKW